MEATAVATAAVAWPRAQAQAQGPRALATTALTDGVRLVEGAGTNVVLATGSSELVMVDCGEAQHSAALLATAAELSPSKRVDLLFNTHWHLEHTGANESLGGARTKIVAHENTKQWMSTRIRCDWRKRNFEPRPPAARPTETFTASGSRRLGHETIDYGYLPRGHTDGDIYVWFREANVLAAGDVVAVGSYPVLDFTTGGWLGELIDATETLHGLVDDGTKIVPGSGPVVGKAHVASQLAMLTTVYERLRTLARKSLSADEMIAEGITREFDAEWGDPTLFVRNAHEAISGYYREMRIA